MSKRGRPAYTIPRAEWKVHLPVDLAAQVELLLKDPMREKVAYGARNKLIEELLRRWLDEQVRKVAEAGRGGTA